MVEEKPAMEILVFYSHGSWPTCWANCSFGVLYNFFSTAYLSVFILVGMGLLGLIFKPLMEAMKSLPNDSDLKTLQAWAKLLEKEQFENPLLLKILKPVKQKEFLASKALKQLENLTFMVENRTNLLYLIFNILFWVDFYVLYRLKNGMRWPVKT